MQSIKVDYKKRKLVITDQNKKIVWFLRFMVGLNILNAVIFYLIFNNQEDSLKWIWLIFAVINVLLMYILFTRVSLQNKFDLDEIEAITPIGFLGLFLSLKNGKYRKIFMPRESEDAKKLAQTIQRKA